MSPEGQSSYRMGHYLCQSKVSELDLYASTLKKLDAVNEAEDHDLPCKHIMDTRFDPHRFCQPGGSFSRDWKPLQLNSGLLTVSAETKMEATKLLYSTNTFSFDSLKTMRKWLASIPPDLRVLVQSIRLEIWWCKGKVLEQKNDKRLSPYVWTKFFDQDLAIQLPNLTDLNLAIHLPSRTVRCRDKQDTTLICMFLPLHRLKSLKKEKLIVVIHEYGENTIEDSGQCSLDLKVEEWTPEKLTHEERAKIRKRAAAALRHEAKMRREWTEHIEEVILTGRSRVLRSRGLREWMEVQVQPWGSVFRPVLRTGKYLSYINI